LVPVEVPISNALVPTLFYEYAFRDLPVTSVVGLAKFRNEEDKHHGVDDPVSL
jgi:hypothetical protein